MLFYADSWKIWGGIKLIIDGNGKCNFVNSKQLHVEWKGQKCTERLGLVGAVLL